MSSDSTYQMLIYRRGWAAATKGDDLANTPPGWPSVTLPSISIRHHPELSVTTTTAAGSTVAILGRPVDIHANTTDGNQIATGVLNTLRSSGLTAAIHLASRIGGRFALLIGHNGTIHALTDCAGTMRVFWASDANSLLLASHQQLIAALKDLQVDREAVAFRKELTAKRVGGTVYWPGVSGPYREVRPVLPNHYLTYRAGTSVTHRRYYPNGPKKRMEAAQAYEQFRHFFLGHVRLLIDSAAAAPFGISLTGGLDSRTTLAASVDQIRRRDLAWTFYNFRTPSVGGKEDLLTANKIALSAGLPHTILELEESKHEAFNTAYDTTFAWTKQHKRLAGTLYDQLPQNILELQSMAAEIGTGFYNRRDSPLTAERLLHLFSGRNDFTATRAIDAIAEFMHYANFGTSQFYDHDYHDFYYWESRNATWAMLRVQEIDMSHDVTLPFNQRDIIEALQAFSERDRLTRLPLRRLTSERMPWLR